MPGETYCGLAIGAGLPEYDGDWLPPTWNLVVPYAHVTQMLSAMHWEHFQHGADIGVRGIGATPEQAFQQAALALTAVITDPETVSATMSVPIQCEAPDLELLFVDWLNALIYEMATRRMLFRKFEVQIDGAHLNAVAIGEPVKVSRHKPVVEVKGATYTELSVHQQTDGAWFAQCVVDV